MAGVELTAAPMRWVFTGDSVTQGAAHTGGARDYVQLFEERLRWELGRRRDHVVCTGVSGRTLMDLADDLEWSVLQYRPHVVSIMLGLNDCLVPTAPTDFYESYGRVVARIREAGAAIILHTPNRVRTADRPDYPGLDRLASAVRRLAAMHGAVLIDHYRAWAGLERTGATEDLLGETCHPNASGHRALARLLLTGLGMWDAGSATARLSFPHDAELDYGV